MSDVTLLTQVAGENPTDTTVALILADAVQEAGDEAGAQMIRRNALQQAAHEAALAAGGVAAAKAMLDGYQIERADRKRAWRTKTVSDKASGKLRGALSRLVGATDRRGRALTCVSFAVVAGDVAPTYEGESYHFETESGRRINHPLAYKRVAKSAVIVYCPASHVVTVGADWLLAHAAELTA